MKVYAESSAVLAWLFDEPSAKTCADALSAAETVVVSELTIVECRRVVRRAVTTDVLTKREGSRLLVAFGNAAAHWMRSAVTQEILDVASGPFPVEPIRTLDAIHLATAFRIRTAIPDLHMLTLDKRIRDNAEAMGFAVVPDRLSIIDH